MAVKYLVTGAAGNLGSSIVRELVRRQLDVRALVHSATDALPREAECFIGDVTDIESLRKFFALPQDCEAVVIHSAGIVTIYPRFSQKVYDVNVGGTRNIVELCLETHVKKLVYVSSVHAIPELPDGAAITEVKSFDPDRIVGFYGKTKAEASQLVMDAVDRGLNASIVFPSGLLGPGDAHGHITQMLIDTARNKLPAGINGGYDFSDVRDVAVGVISAANLAGPGENYILGNRYVSVRELLRTIHELSGAKLVKVMFPAAVVVMLCPAFAAYYKAHKRPPLFTRYSLYTLMSNSNFSSEKARRDLGYRTRPIEQTISDTLTWLKEKGKI